MSYLTLNQLLQDRRWSQLKPKETIKVPATYAQQALYFVQTFQPDSKAYHIPFEFRFDRQIDLAALEIALQCLVQRHDILRTGFEQNENGLHQIVHGSVELQHDFLDATQWTEQNIRHHCQQWSQQPFDLTKPPLFRSIIMQLKEGWSWFICFHHVAFDHLSIVQFSVEINSAYQRALMNPEALDYSPLPISMVDYAVWQGQFQILDQLKDKLEYWKSTIVDPSVLLDMPSDYPRPQVMLGSGRDYWFHFDSPTSALVRKTAKQFKVSRFLLTMTQLAVVLHRYSKTEQFFIGTPFANRSDQAELQHVLGCFMNTLPLPFDFRDNPSFELLLQRTQFHFLKVFERQEVPFQHLIETLNPPRDTSHHPLFQVAFMYQDPPMSLNIAGAKGKNQHLHSGSSKFDFTFWLWDEENGDISGNLEYSTELFGLPYIETLLNVYSRVVKSTCENPQMPIDQLPLVDISNINAVALNGPDQIISPVSVHGFIAEHAKKRPDAIAIKSQDYSLSYAEFWAQACHMAQFLSLKGAKKGDFIGVCLNRSSALIVSVIGIIQAGCAYIPLDPEYPQDRLDYMISHSKMSMIMSEQSIDAKILKVDERQGEELEIFVIEDVFSDFSFQTEIRHTHISSLVVDLEDPAYVIYTSGSTGLPKGVVIPHRSLSNFLQSMAIRPGFTSEDTLLAVTTLSFDISILELFLPLSQGGTVYIASAAVSKDPELLNQKFQTLRPSVMQATPATWRMLLTIGWQGHANLKILVGGEALPEDLISELLKSSQQVWNMYGPTETTIWSTCAQITNDSDPVVIGSPIHNTQCYIVDKTGQALPSGVPGELLIGGSGVALGYLYQDELTHERFIPNPVTGTGKLYRTGDLVTRLANGQLRYHNRLDNQVKIRGFRIELGEVEQVLLKMPQIQAGAVVVQGTGFDKRLVAFYQIAAGQTLSMMKIKRTLTDILPRHMVPELYVALDSIPLTPSGKIDRKSLAQYKVQTAQDITQAQLPASPSEIYYANLWKKILKRDSMSINDHFFDLGGHSLASLGVIAAAKNDHGIVIPANALVMNTLGQLANLYPIAETINEQSDHLQLENEQIEPVPSELSIKDTYAEVEDKNKKPWWKKWF